MSEHLGRAREPGPHHVARGELGAGPHYPGHQLRALGPGAQEARVPEENVDQLGQFVESGSAQQASYWVTREASWEAQAGPVVSSALRTMERNLNTGTARPPRPTRCWTVQYGQAVFQHCGEGDDKPDGHRKEQAGERENDLQSPLRDRTGVRRNCHRTVRKMGGNRRSNAEGGCLLVGNHRMLHVPTPRRTKASYVTPIPAPLEPPSTGSANNPQSGGPGHHAHPHLGRNAKKSHCRTPGARARAHCAGNHRGVLRHASLT